MWVRESVIQFHKDDCPESIAMPLANDVAAFIRERLRLKPAVGHLGFYQPCLGFDLPESQSLVRRNPPERFADVRDVEGDRTEFQEFRDSLASDIRSSIESKFAIRIP